MSAEMDALDAAALEVVRQAVRWRYRFINDGALVAAVNALILAEKTASPGEHLMETQAAEAKRVDDADAFGAW